MKKIFITKDGEVTRKLTPDEVKHYADMGDEDAKKEIAKTAKKATTEERLKRIEDFLGI